MLFSTDDVFLAQFSRPRTTSPWCTEAYVYMEFWIGMNPAHNEVLALSIDRGAYVLDVSTLLGRNSREDGYILESWKKMGEINNFEDNPQELDRYMLSISSPRNLERIVGPEGTSVDFVWALMAQSEFHVAFRQEIEVGHQDHDSLLSFALRYQSPNWTRCVRNSLITATSS